MSSSRSSRKRDDKTSFKPVPPFALFYQLTYMSAMAAAGLSRSKTFEIAAQSGSPAARYFAAINTLVEEFRYDYPEACRRIGTQAKSENMRSFLLRLSDALRPASRWRTFWRARPRSRQPTTRTNTSATGSAQAVVERVFLDRDLRCADRDHPGRVVDDLLDEQHHDDRPDQHRRDHGGLRRVDYLALRPARGDDRPHRRARRSNAARSVWRGRCCRSGWRWRQCWAWSACRWGGP